MPLFKTIIPKINTKIHIWNITETLDELNNLNLSRKSDVRLRDMKSELHQKGFLSIRHLLKLEGYTDYDLFYNGHGKPHLKDGKHISITHSFTFSGIIISDDEAGIDIEKNREKINVISHKFIDTENDFIVEKNKVEQLTVLWGAKESLYKIYPHGGLSFRRNIPIDPFKLKDRKTTGWIKAEDWDKKYQIHFEPLTGFTLVYAYPVLQKK